MVRVLNVAVLVIRTTECGIVVCRNAVGAIAAFTRRQRMSKPPL
jgi:hypothetical protein